MFPSFKYTLRMFQKKPLMNKFMTHQASHIQYNNNFYVVSNGWQKMLKYRLPERG